MKKLLHIIAAPRGEDSRTLQVSEVFLDVFRQEHPDWVVEEIDITKEKLPSLTMKRIDGKYVLLSGRELAGDLKRTWQEIIAQPMDMGSDKQKAALQRAKEEAVTAAKDFVPSEQTYAAGLTGGR